jgi:hypothetical protein
MRIRAAVLASALLLAGPAFAGSAPDAPKAEEAEPAPKS